jgi:glycosyltransferase involved in cell wall biosynthesis
MPRVLVVTTIDRTLAGHVYPYLCLLKEMGLKVELACRSASEAAVAKLDTLRLPRHEVRFSRNPLHPANLRALWQLRAILARGEYDLVDVHTPVAAWLTRLAVRLFHRQMRTLYTCHGLPFHTQGSRVKNRLILWLEMLAGRWTDHLVVINREDQAAAIRHRLVPAGQITYMAGSGVDTRLFNPLRVQAARVQEARWSLGLSEDKVLFLYVGEFTPRKRQADVVRALALLADRGVHVAFAGDGSLRDQVQALSTSLGVERLTHFLGYRQDVPVLLRAARASVLSSEAEGVPKSIMESLSMEVPAIGTNVRGTRELLEDGCGLLVPLGDAAALAGAMRWMVEHRKEAAEMGRKGRKKMQGPYELQNTLRVQGEVYRKLLGLQ